MKNFTKNDKYTVLDFLQIFKFSTLYVIFKII